MKGEKKGSAALSSNNKKQQQQQSLLSAVAPMETPSSSASQNILASNAVNNRTQQQAQPPKHVYNELALRNNYQLLEQGRTCQAAVSGITSGILGLTGTMGFLFYFFCVVIQALVWNYKSGFRWSTFFTSRSLLVTHSLIGGLFTYVLFWVFVYGLVHVY